MNHPERTSNVSITYTQKMTKYLVYIQMSDWLTTNSTYGSFYDPNTKLQIYANHHSSLVKSNMNSSNQFSDKPKMILWKACRVYNPTVNVYVQLVVPSDAQIINISGSNKYRVSKAFVNKIIDKNQNEYQECRSFLYGGPSIVYKVGTMVYPDSFDSDPHTECSHGIHGHKFIDECDVWF